MEKREHFASIIAAGNLKQQLGPIRIPIKRNDRTRVHALEWEAKIDEMKDRQHPAK